MRSLAYTPVLIWGVYSTFGRMLVDFKLVYTVVYVCFFLLVARYRSDTYVELHICTVITYSRLWINGVRLSILLVVS